MIFLIIEILSILYYYVETTCGTNLCIFELTIAKKRLVFNRKVAAKHNKKIVIAIFISVASRPTPEEIYLIVRYLGMLKHS
jgi:hypothetical protein